MPPYYLIHQPGKVGSQTLEQVLKFLAPEARIERHHYLSDKRLDYLLSMCRQGADADGITRQIDDARRVRTELDRQTPGSVWVLCGFRDPLALAQSAFFQNLATYCPWVDCNAADLDAEADRLLGFFDLHFDRLRSGLKPNTFEEALLDLKLEGPEPWFDDEFGGFHGVDVYGQEIGAAAFVTFASDRFNFCLYRAETLSAALPALLERIGLQPVQVARNWNASESKEYARLYSVFKKRFRPTIDMIEYYYDRRFLRHFYRQNWNTLQSSRGSAMPPQPSFERKRDAAG